MVDENLVENTSDSILSTIKDLLGVGIDDTSFDPSIIVLINSALSTLHKIGVGPKGYKISGANNLWSEFLLDRTDLEEVKTNVYLRVRLMFDPPQNSFLVSAIKEQIEETNFYIELYHNPEVSPVETEEPLEFGTI